MLSAIRNLDYVIILCQDLEPMKRFYHEVLGFPMYHDGKEWIELRIGAVLLTLCRRGKAGVDDGPPPPQGSASLELAFRVAPAEVASCYTELQQKGVVITEPPTNQPWGHRTLFFKDPEDNILEIYADL